jgi:hypothetical protein
MLHGSKVRTNDKRVIAFIPPPISSPDCDLEEFYPAHEVLLTEIRERLLEPEHLREKVNFLHEGELPGLKFGEVFDLGVVAKGLAGVVPLVGWCG